MSIPGISILERKPRGNSSQTSNVGRGEAEVPGGGKGLRACMSEEEDQAKIEEEVTEETNGEEGSEEEEHDDAEREVASSMVSSWGYDREGETLSVQFVNGHQQSYQCSPALWEEAKEAPSPGHFMHENLL